MSLATASSSSCCCLDNVELKSEQDTLIGLALSSAIGSEDSVGNDFLLLLLLLLLLEEIKTCNIR